VAGIGVAASQHSAQIAPLFRALVHSKAGPPKIVAADAIATEVLSAMHRCPREPPL
jgi:hypothetical protein